MLRKILLIGYVLILAAIIFLADRKGTRYVLGFVGNIPYGDKLGHFCLMGGFAFFANLVLDARTFRLWKIDNLLLGSAIVVVLVTLEEISQIFVSGRTFDPGDLFFDYLGIFLFGELARWLCRKKKT
ncbi:MAG: VanZ family protein [Acidobacteria bacterium]|nr:VanZ family protein [Acidobacteriota bacterium]